MDALAGGDLFLFEGFRLDRQARALCRRDEAGEFVPIAVGSRALEVLDVLVARAGDLVPRDEFMAAVWPATAVEDSNLNIQIAALRQVLDEGRVDRSCIQTIPGRGYRLAVPVRRVEAESHWHSALPHGDPGTRPRLSIVVLPFTNLSNDPGQQYFADRITEDLTTDLSRIAGMLVISGNTAFTYLGKRVDTKQIGRELCVRYVLEGSVRRSGDQIRINAQLIDTETDAHLWAERFDGDTSDLFALQDEVTSRIANALGVELIVAEAARPTENPDALDYILQGRAASLRPNSRAVDAENIGLYERALALDPHSVEAMSRLANALVARADENMTDSVAADIARAEGLIDRALAASPRSGYAHFVKGRVLRMQHRLEEAILELETSLSVDRNSVWSLHHLALCKLLTGSIEEVIPLYQQAIRLSPREPRIGWWYRTVGEVHLLQSRINEAIVWLEKARSDIPAAAAVRIFLASAYALRGETDRASAELAEAQRLGSEDRYSSVARYRASVWYRGMAPKFRALIETTFITGLRLAGVPEE